MTAEASTNDSNRSMAEESRKLFETLMQKRFEYMRDNPSSEEIINHPELGLFYNQFLDIGLPYNHPLLQDFRQRCRDAAAEVQAMMSLESPCALGELKFTPPKDFFSDTPLQPSMEAETVVPGTTEEQIPTDQPPALRILSHVELLELLQEFKNEPSVRKNLLMHHLGYKANF